MNENSLTSANLLQRRCREASPANLILSSVDMTICVTRLLLEVIVIRSLKRIRIREHQARKQIRKAIHYFQTNAERMRYAEFRRQGLFVGSGVAEAGCKTVIGQRLKQSGMRWTVDGANAIIALRCCQLSREEFWELRSVS